MKSIALGLLIMATSVVYGQTINLSGKILNSAGSPIANAVVKLVGKNMKDTTNSSGDYLLSYTPPVSINASSDLSQIFHIQNGILEFNLQTSSSVKIEVYNLVGKLLKRTSMTNAQAGLHRIDLTDLNWSSNALIIKSYLGNQSFTMRPNVLAIRGNTATAVDTIVTTAAGYKTDSLAIPSYEANQNINLDTVITTVFTGSAGCGKAATFTNGTKSVTSANLARQYIVQLPQNYDMNRAYRLIFVIHAWYGNMTETANGTSVPGNGVWAFNGLKGQANNTAIFIAPQGLGSPTGWSQGEADLTFFDDMVRAAKAGSCVDTTRIFSTGFSFGGAMTHVLAARRPNTFRAVVVQDGGTMAGDPAASGKVAYMGVHGDNPSNFVPPDWGRSIRNKFVSINGCTAGQNPPEAAVGSRTHVCYDYTGCDVKYPVKWCTFDGTHKSAPYDGPLVNNNEDDGAKTWVPAVAWAFLSQF